MRLEADTLGSLYLDEVERAHPGGLGRLAGYDHRPGTWATMAAAGPAPYCITGF